MREQTTPQRDKSNPKHSLVKPDSPISLHASVQIVSTYCLLGCLTDWFIGYNPDWECNDLKLHCFTESLSSTQKFVLMPLWRVFINRGCTVSHIQ